MGLSGIGMYDAEIGSYTEDPVTIARVSSIGACCWVFLGVLGFTILVAYIPISGVSDVPAYARTFLYMSVAHHFDDVQSYRSSIAPPPPSF